MKQKYLKPVIKQLTKDVKVEAGCATGYCYYNFNNIDQCGSC